MSFDSNISTKGKYPFDLILYILLLLLLHFRCLMKLVSLFLVIYSAFSCALRSNSQIISAKFS